MTQKKKKYTYDLIKLEDNLTEAYLAQQEEDNEQTRTDLFINIKAIAFAILNVGNYSKYGIDFENTSYEYGLYLFERIITDRFIPEYDDRFPWQKYISKNINHIIFTKRDDLSWQDLITDLEFLLADDERMQELVKDTVTPEQLFDRHVMAEKLYKPCLFAAR